MPRRVGRSAGPRDIGERPGDRHLVDAANHRAGRQTVVVGTLPAGAARPAKPSVPSNALALGLVVLAGCLCLAMPFWGSPSTVARSRAARCSSVTVLDVEQPGIFVFYSDLLVAGMVLWCGVGAVAFLAQGWPEYKWSLFTVPLGILAVVGRLSAEVWTVASLDEEVSSCPSGRFRLWLDRHEIDLGTSGIVLCARAHGLEPERRSVGH